MISAVLVIWKQNIAHFPHIMKNVPPTTKKYDTLNLCTMGEMKTSRFPHSTEFRYKKKHAQISKFFYWSYEESEIISIFESGSENTISF